MLNTIENILSLFLNKHLTFIRENDSMNSLHFDIMDCLS